MVRFNDFFWASGTMKIRRRYMFSPSSKEHVTSNCVSLDIISASICGVIFTGDTILRCLIYCNLPTNINSLSQNYFFIGLPEIESFVEQSKLWELCPDSIFVFLLL